MSSSVKIPRLFTILAVLVVTAAGCGVSRGDSSLSAATITPDDGTELSVPMGDVDSISAEIAASDRFRDLAFTDMDTPEIRHHVLTRLVWAAISKGTMEAAGGTVADGDATIAVDGLVSQLEGPFPGEGAEVAAEIPGYLDMLVQVQTSQLGLGTVLAADPEAQGLPCASHILVEDEALAIDLADQLDGGADFAALAVEHSVDPGSGANGGDLGCADPSLYVAEFRDAILGGAEGELIGPIQTNFGFHLIVISGYEAPDPLALGQERLEQSITGAIVVVDPSIGIWNPQTLVVAGTDG